MGFQFSLATVLRFRESVEKREELNLQKVLVEIATTRRTIEKLTAHIEALQKARNEAMQKSIAALHLQSMLNETNTAIARRKALIQSLDALEQKRRAQMDVYQLAHRNRQMLSDMSIRQRDAYDQERARAEQKFLDDIFAARLQRS